MAGCRAEGCPDRSLTPSVARSLREFEEASASKAGHPEPQGNRGELISGYDLAAQGLLRYFRTHGLLSE